MSNLIFKDEVFIPILEAGNYLVDDRVHYSLDKLYLRYIGLAAYYRKVGEAKYECKPDVYINGMVLLQGDDVKRFYRQELNEEYLSTWTCHLHCADVTADKKAIKVVQGSYFKLTIDYPTKDFLVYVKKSDLDDLAEQYGISKNTEIYDDTPAVEIPEKSYDSELLQIANRASSALWDNHDPKKPPTKPMLTVWLKEKGIKLSANEITQIDSVIRPNRYKGGKNSKK